jgi:hypothetical protein
MSPVPSDPYPDFLVGALANGDQIDARFAELYKTLDPAVRGIDKSNIAAPGVQEDWMAGGALGLAKGAFSAYRSSTPATSVGPTVIVFDTEEYDISGWYDPATGRFTPQLAGRYRLGGAVQFNAIAAASQALDIYKNGVVAKRLGSDGFVSGTVGLALNGWADVVANGTTDFFDLRWTGSAANAPIGGAHLTYFQGHLIGRS